MKDSFIHLLESIKAHPVLNPEIGVSEYVHIDLSTRNRAFKEVHTWSAKDFEFYIVEYIKSYNAKVAYGGYLEHRDIYKRSAYFHQATPENDRNIHIGLDLWTEAGEPIYAPLDAEIHSFKNNTNYGDYGPTIVLKHNVEGVKFFTLYGHLSLQTLEDKNYGGKIKAGQQIGTLGSMQVNGEYPPHLHFQVLKDIQDYKGDYPGVVNRSELEFYKTNCPDPNLLLKLQ